MCGRRSAPHAEDPVELEDEDDDDGIDALASCSGFEVCLLRRSWCAAPRFLNEVIGSGAEAWALCAVALARAAHDHAADAAGAAGRALPLLCASGPSAGGARATSGLRGQVEVMLVEEGPGPLVVGSSQPPPRDRRSLGAIRMCAGVHAWLNICRPAALWSTLGRGHVGPLPGEGPQMDSGGSGSAMPNLAHQVVAALQAALSVQFTDHMVSEIWEALAELDSAGTLRRRAGGWWTQLGQECAGFVL